jgi:uncharacterized membrane protein YesL
MTTGRQGGPVDHRGSVCPQFGEGVLFRLTNRVYWFLATELCLVIASLPFVVALLFLDRDASNAILYAIAGAFLGPALAATLHCIRKIMREQDLDPTRDFVRGYRLNAADTLRYWVPAVAVLTMLALNLRFIGTSGPAWQTALKTATLAVAVLLSLWLMNMMVVSTSFSFRQRDLARLSVYYLGKAFRITLGNLAILFLVGVLLLFTSDWVLLLCGSLFVSLFALNTADLVKQVEVRFTGPAENTTPENTTTPENDTTE